MESDEYIEPSTGARALLIVYVALMALLIFIARAELNQLQFSENLTREQLDSSIESFKDLSNYLLGFTILQALLFSTYLILIANKSIKSGKFPPKGTRVIKRTKVVHGKKATHSAIISYLIALFSWFPVLIPVYIMWLLNEFT